MAEHTVRPGDCIESIAFEHGHFWKAVWNHPDNHQLKSLRKDPNVLMAGDKVFVPDLRPKEESGDTEQRHSFKRKGVPSLLQIVVKRFDEPRANEPYVVDIDGQIDRGTTEEDGLVKIRIPPHAKQGKLIVGQGQDQEMYLLALGHMDPVNEISGIQARLNNLGFDAGPADGQWTEKTREALKEFQEKHGMTATGEADQATQDELVEANGC
jgi:hypothetical protein